MTCDNYEAARYSHFGIVRANGRRNWRRWLADWLCYTFGRAELPEDL